MKQKMLALTRLSNNWNPFLKIILGISCLAIVIFVCIVVSLTLPFYGGLILGDLRAAEEVNQMQKWDIPPHSEVIGFEIHNGDLPHACFKVGTLILASTLEEDEIREFYNSRYLEAHYFGRELYISSGVSGSESPFLYNISATSDGWDCS